MSRQVWAWAMGLGPAELGGPYLSEPCAAGEHSKCRHPSMQRRVDGCQCDCHVHKHAA
jgi:hypothetical protein